MKRCNSLFLGAVLIAAPALAQEESGALPAYKADAKTGTLGFSGTHAGNVFNGNFGEWSAEIRFSPAALSESRITATIETASAKTGNAMYDGTLPSADWFDTKQYPQAKFMSTRLEKTAGGYRAEGTLTLRGKSVPVALTFALTPADGDAASVKVEASAKLDRLAFDIGAQSDAKAEWVSREIPLTLSFVAQRQ